MRSRPCGACSGELPLRARADARFCSTRCRVAAHRRSGIPLELRSRPRWVRYSAQKVPLTVNGEVASSTDPHTWGTHQAASATHVGAGLGFVLNGDGIVCVDLDDCLLPGGQVTAVAADLIRRAGSTYVEVSPSGRGLHIWGRAQLSRGRVRMVAGQRVEAYPSGRYITVTGQQFAGSTSRLGDVTAVTG